MKLAADYNGKTRFYDTHTLILLCLNSCRGIVAGMFFHKKSERGDGGYLLINALKLANVLDDVVLVTLL